MIKSHHITKLKKFSSKNLPILIQTPLLYLKNKHKHKTLNQFYKNYKKQIYKKYINSSHKNHNLLPINQTNKKNKKHILHTINNLQNKILSYQKKIKQINQNYKTIKKKIITTQQKILKKIKT